MILQTTFEIFSSCITLWGFRVKERNFANKRIFKFTDILAGMGKAKSRHDMNTAGVRVEIKHLFVSLCKSTYCPFFVRFQHILTFWTTQKLNFAFSYWIYQIIKFILKYQWKAIDSWQGNCELYNRLCDCIFFQVNKDLTISPLCNLLCNSKRSPVLNYSVLNRLSLLYVFGTTNQNKKFWTFPLI